MTGTWHNDEYDPYHFSLAPQRGCVGIEGELDYFICALDDETCARLLQRRVRHFNMSTKRHIGNKEDIVILCGYDGGKGLLKATYNKIVDLNEDEIVFKGDTSVGFSGGPVLNDGELIGLFKMRDRDSDLQWATPIKAIGAASGSAASVRGPAAATEEDAMEVQECGDNHMNDDEDSDPGPLRIVVDTPALAPPIATYEPDTKQTATSIMKAAPSVARNYFKIATPSTVVCSRPGYA